jgi:uncharacterized membrane protein
MLNFIASAEALEWATGALVFIVAMFMGTCAAQGMNAVQWAGAAAAVLGSVTLAVLVRVWPAEARGRTQTQED